ncbi:Agd3-related carbohydrate deacetylase [Streptomyces sp. NPDC001107]
MPRAHVGQAASGLPAIPGTGATPPAPPVPRKQLVPVRADAPAQTPAKPGDRVAMRQLIIATDARDFGLPAWRQILDRIGTPYDVLLTKSERLDAARLVRPDGTGRYDAILLTDHTLSGDSGASTVSNTEWGALFDYERTYKVRQVSLSTSAAGFPCLRAESEGPVGTEPAHVALTASGRKIFDYLAPDIRMPLTLSYVYRSALKAGCHTQPILTLGSSVVGALRTDKDGREELGVGFSVTRDDLMGDLLGFGLVRWATRGVFLGEQRHWLNVDIDDWFLTTEHGPPHVPGKSFRLTGPEALAFSREQAAFRRRYPLVGDFKLNLAFNGSLLNPAAPAMCHPGKTPDTLTSYTRCLMDQFRWISHTLTHPQMNTTPYDRNYHEIKDNLAQAALIGLPVPAAVLKTPEYSGLGVYAPQAHTLAEPVDHGLRASNKDLLRAASDLGVKYLHGNMSFPSLSADCFNCGIHHPLQRDLMVVPDWPVAIAFEAINPHEQVARYYDHPVDKKDTAAYYRRTIDHEADLALVHLMTGSVYAHTLHQSNAHQYAPGRCLVFDWLHALLARYSTYFSVPLKNPDWLTLAHYVEARTSHFAELKSHEDAVWNRVTNAITYTPTAHGSLFITGVATRPATDSDQHGPDEAERYGSDPVSRLGLSSGDTVTLTARPR